MRQDFWSIEQEKLARELMDARATESEFAEKLGRSRTAAWSHFHYCRKRSEFDAKRPYDARYAKSKRQARRTDVSRPSEAPDPAALRDAELRRLAPRSITAAVCGDPGPGQSALDQKREHNWPWFL